MVLRAANAHLYLMPKLKAQLHIHSHQDPVDNIRYTEKQIIDRAAKLGYDVLAFTCHNVVIFNEDLKKYAEEKRILLIPGIEKSIQKNHVVILNANIAAQTINSIEDLKNYRKKNPQSLIIAPHPYYPSSLSLKEKLDQNHKLFDAIEYSWFHSKRLNKYNEKAVKASEKYDLPLIGTSDNHLLRYFNQTYSIIDAEKKTVESIFKAIKDNKINIVSHDIPFSKLVSIYLEMWARFFIKRIMLR